MVSAVVELLARGTGLGVAFGRIVIQAEVE
jgi:hypothetical protein